MNKVIKQHCERVRRASDVLGEVLRSAFENAAKHGEKDPRAGFISRHAWNIQERGKDVVTALAAGRTGCLPILNRPGLESLFNLGAAAADPQFAHAKQVCEMQEMSRLTKLIGNSGDPELDKELERQIRLHELVVRGSGDVTGDERFATHRIAEKAGMANIYRTDYFACSQMTHPNTRELGLERSAEEVADDVRLTVFIQWVAGDLVNGLYCRSADLRTKLAGLQGQA